MLTHRPGMTTHQLPRCPFWNLPGLGISRHRHRHQDGLSRMRHFDAALLEAPLHAAVEFALHRPAATVGTADLADDRHHLAIDLVDAPQFEIAADRLPVFVFPTHFADDVLQDLAGAVAVFLVGNVDGDGRVAGA